MQFLREPKPTTQTFALFAGAFHPPTVAHLALAQQARQTVDEVVFALPREFPHKTYEGATLEQRIAMLLSASDAPIALFDTNYFFDMAEELSQHSHARVQLLLGEDAAARLLTWDYGLDRSATETYLRTRLERFPILTTGRDCATKVPAYYRDHLLWLPTPQEAIDVSSTEVRHRIATQQPWRHLVPATIHQAVEKIYGSPAN
jgi:cytidyltransferase-like protein